MLDMLKFSRKPYKVGLVLSGGGSTWIRTRGRTARP